MKLAVSKHTFKTAIAALATAGTVGLGYLGCQAFGQAAMFTAAGCLGGLGGTAQLVEMIKPNRKPQRSKNV